jgi:hypothetical protein
MCLMLSVRHLLLVLLSLDYVYALESYSNRDTLDPEVSTLSTLTNLQNSMFIPNLGSFINRRPIYNLTPTPTNPLQLPQVNVHALGRTQTSQTAMTAQRTRTRMDEQTEGGEEDEAEGRPGLTHMSTIDSTMSESRYAVLPHGRTLEGWTAGEKDELNDHVRHMLHSRRAGFKRGMRGFGQYVRQRECSPFLVTLTKTDSFSSTGLLRHIICNSNHIIRTGMGTLPDR